MAKKIKTSSLPKNKEQRDAQREKKKEEREREAAGIQDEFQAKGFEAVEWIQQKKTIFSGLLIAVVAFGAILGVTNVIRSDTAEKASRLFELATEAHEATVGTAPADEGELSFTSEKDRANEARTRFQKVIDEHGSHDVAVLAHLYVGKTSLQLGEYDAALAAFQAFLSASATGHPYRFAGLSGKATALEGKGDTAAAISAWEERLRLDAEAGKDAALLALGRLYKSDGKEDKAKATLDRLVKDYPDSPLKTNAEELLGTAS